MKEKNHEVISSEKNIDMDSTLQEFIDGGEEEENSFENIDNHLQEVTNSDEYDSVQVNFKDGYSLKVEEIEDSRELTISGDKLNSDITLTKNHTGEIETVSIDGDDHLHLVFKIPESNITLDPFLDGKLASYKNPDQRKLVIIKIGTSSITTDSRKINYAIIQDFAEIIKDLKGQGYDTLIVSSGAKGLGRSLLNKPCENISTQSLTAIGQAHLISIYDNIFSNYDMKTAQILLAYNDLEYKENIRNTIDDLVNNDIVPIVNSNDPVICSDNIDIDNDKLAAAIGKILNASHLFIISDSGGLYDADPKENPDATLIPMVSEIDENLEALSTTSSGSGLGTGGIKSKIIAAKSCLSRNSEMNLLSKDHIREIPAIVADQNHSYQGTRFNTKQVFIAKN